MKTQRKLFACVVAIATALLTAGAMSSCSAVPGDQRIGIDAPSGSEAQFGLVGEYLANRCGTLDCHGQMSRSFRVYGCQGMRLDPKAIPVCSPPLGGSVTSPAEHAATYRSLVGLEPTVMSEVYDNHGAHPELLTFVRKARGIEAHKGGALITPGDNQDICVTSWLAGSTNQMACGLAVGFPMIPQDASVQ
jgi:hypothetical protein